MYYIKRALFTAAISIGLLAFSANTSFGQINDTTSLDVQSDSSYTLAGKVVTSQTNSPVSQATVKLSKASQSAMTATVVDSTTTNQSGKFQLTGISSGNYNVVVEADNYQKWKKQFQINKTMNDFKVKLKAKQ